MSALYSSIYGNIHKSWLSVIVRIICVQVIIILIIFYHFLHVYILGSIIRKSAATYYSLDPYFPFFPILV